MENIIKRLIEAHIRQNVSTAIPAKVVSVTSLNSKQVIDAIPLVNRVYEDNTVLEPATLTDIPLVFPSAGGGVLSFPIAVGDTVLLVYSMRSIDEWSSSDGSAQTPRDSRHFSRSDAIAIPGLYTDSTHLQPNTTDVELKFSGSSVKIKPDGDVTVDVAKDLIATVAGDVVADATGSISITSLADIDITATGTITITGALVNINP